MSGELGVANSGFMRFTCLLPRSRAWALTQRLMKIWNAIVLGLLSLLSASAVVAQAPDIREEMIYRDDASVVDGSISSMVLLSPNGRYSTVAVYHALSRGIWATGHRNAGPNESGTYTYTKAAANSATLTFRPEVAGALSSVTGRRELTFVTPTGGSLFIQYAEGMRGNFQLRPRSGGAVANVSTRGTATSTKPLIVGFVVEGAAGISRDVLIRAIGPGLRQFGITDAAEDTTLELVSTGVRPVRNDDWTNDPTGVNASALLGETADVVEALGAFVSAFPFTRGTKDAAYSTRLRPGAYTLVVRTKSDQPSEVLGEVYIVP